MSRLGRNYVETGKYLRDLFQAKGVRFISVDDNFDSILMDEFDRTIIMIKNIFSEQYSRDVSLKTRSSLEIKRRQGKYVGAVPIYGYQKSEDNKYRLSVDPNTHMVVQAIFNMKLQGMSAAGIASDLNDLGILSPIAYKREKGIPHPTGGYADKNNARWSATTVLRILRDETYTGALIQRKQSSFNYKSETMLALDKSEWSRTENAHPPIIFKTDYNTVQRILMLDTRISSEHNRVHIFSGLLICGCCGGNMTRKTRKHNDRQYVYYYCPTGKSRGCKLSFMVRENDLFQMVTQKIRERINHIHKLKSSISAPNIKELVEKVCSRQIAVCNQNIHDLQNYKIHLHDSLTYGIIDNTEFRAHQDYYDEEIARLSAEIIALQRKSLCTGKSLEEEFVWMDNFCQFIDIRELDRFTIVKMIQGIRVIKKNEIAIDFAFQHEYEQAILYLDSGG